MTLKDEKDIYHIEKRKMAWLYEAAGKDIDRQ